MEMGLTDEQSHSISPSELSSCEGKEAVQETIILSDRHVLFPLWGLGVGELLWAPRISQKNLKGSSTLEPLVLTSKRPDSCKAELRAPPFSKLMHLTLMSGILSGRNVVSDTQCINRRSEPKPDIL